MKIRLLAVIPLVAASLALGVASPAAACACGGVAPQPGDTISVNEERAIVSWAAGSSGKQEQIDLRLGMLAQATETGLIFPTPGPATVTSGTTDDFDRLEAAIAPRVETRDDWWSGDGYGVGAAGGAPGPQVLAQVQLGPVEATTLAASDAQGLADWLNAHDYAVSDAVGALLADYVDRGWYFVALRLTSDKPLDGGLDPLRFTFDSDELVYPMDLSKAAVAPQIVRLYVFDDHRTQLEALGSPGSPYQEGTVYYAGPSPVLPDRGGYLTVFDLYLGAPADQAADLGFARAASDRKLIPVRTVDRPIAIGGLALGPVLVFVGSLAFLVVVAVLVLRRRRPPTSRA